MSELSTRTKAFALQVCRLLRSLELSALERNLAHQLIRSATSVGANHRAFTRAKSRADGINKLKIVEEECDECIYWLELLRDLDILDGPTAEALIDEAEQILKMTVASIATLRSRNAR